MLSFKTFVLSLTAAATVSARATPFPSQATPTPNETWHPTPTKTAHLTGVTHSVVAGLGGLHFDPDNVVAEIGDVVEWHFNPMNHSVAQSSFWEPCKPKDCEESFFAGFQFATEESQACEVFQIVVKDKEPIWYYSPQRIGSECQRGMVGVINQNYDNPAMTLSKHKQLAARTRKSVVPQEPQGGAVLANIPGGVFVEPNGEDIADPNNLDDN